MRRLFAAFALLLFFSGMARAQEGRHFVLQGDDALVPIGITGEDSIELRDYHGEWSRLSNLHSFVLADDAHIDFSRAREFHDLMVNNTATFINNGRITLRGEPVRMGELAGLDGEGVSQALLDLRGGRIFFEKTEFSGSGNFVLPVVEAVNPDGSPAGFNAVAGKLFFEGGRLLAPVNITLDYPGNKLPLAVSEVLEIRGTRLGNALTPDMAVVLQNPSGGSARMRLDFEQRVLNGEAAYVWKVEEVR